MALWFPLRVALYAQLMRPHRRHDGNVNAAYCNNSVRHMALESPEHIDSLGRKQAPKPEFQLRNALYALGTYAELAKFGPQQHLQRVMGRFLAESGGRASGITLPLRVKYFEGSGVFLRHDVMVFPSSTARRCNELQRSK